MQGTSRSCVCIIMHSSRISRHSILLSSSSACIAVLVIRVQLYRQPDDISPLLAPSAWEGHPAEPGGRPAESYRIELDSCRRAPCLISTPPCITEHELEVKITYIGSSPRPTKMVDTPASTTDPRHSPSLIPIKNEKRMITLEA